MAALQAHEWPGNVRELRNVIERVMILAPSDRLTRIDADMLPAELVRGGTDILPNSESITAIPLKERSEEHTSELQSLMRISYAVFCLKKKTSKLQLRLTL